MTPKLMIWSSVVLSAVAQIFLKHGLTQARRNSRRGEAAAMLLGVATQPFVWLWAASFVLATGLWLVGLRRLDLSYAYPLISFGYVLVNLLSGYFFGERVDRNRWIAILVISFGVILTAAS
jgi:drug/metabolite transporter (DMT)-like permease